MMLRLVLREILQLRPGGLLAMGLCCDSFSRMFATYAIIQALLVVAELSTWQ